MGIIARQGIKYSIISYLSFLLGTFSTIFIYPANPEFLGKLRFIQPSAELICPFILFGLSYANIKYHQKLKAKNQHIDFLYICIKFILSNFIFISFIYWLFSKIFPSIQWSDSWNMKQYVLPVALSLALTQLLSKYMSNLKRITISGIFENFFPKLGALTAFISYIYLGISQKNALFIFVSFFVIAVFGLVYYFIRLNKDRKSGSLSILHDREVRLNLLSFCLFSVLGSIGNRLALQIDNLMIPELLDFKQNGIYSILASIVGFLTVPVMGIFTISGPIIVEKLENNKLDELNNFYRKVSKFLFLFGTMLLSCILAGIDYLFLFMKNGKELADAKVIIYILGASTLFDLSTGFNSNIISYSKYFRFTIYAMLLLAVFTIVSNIIFISYFKLGIEGIALATAISLTLFNLIKLGFNYQKFGIHPFSREYIYILLTGIIGVLLVYNLPDFTNNFLNLVSKPVIILLIFFLSNVWFKFIPIKELFSTNIKSFLTGKN